MLFLKIPKDIIIKINENWIEIKGPLGTIKKKKSASINLLFNEKEQKLFLLNVIDPKTSHFYLSMINKLIWGVWKGYSIKLNVIGVGYKVFIEGKRLDLKIEWNLGVMDKIVPSFWMFCSSGQNSACLFSIIWFIDLNSFYFSFIKQNGLKLCWRATW